MSDIERSGSRSASPRRPRTADGGLRDSRSHSRSRKSRERKETHREVKYSRSRSRSVSRGRKSYRGSKYTNVGHRGSSRSRSRSPYRSSRYSRSRSRSYSRSRYSRDRHVYRSHSRSPMSSRRRHVGNRDNPCPSRCLGVFGLSIFTTEQQIHHIFSKYGPVERVQVVIDAKTGRSRGFCFVYFESSEDAKVAKDQCTGMEIDGRRIRVDFSITQRAHTPTPGIYMGKPTHLHDRGWDGPRRREISYRGSYRRSPSPYYSRRRSRYDRSRSRSYSPPARGLQSSLGLHCALFLAFPLLIFRLQRAYGDACMGASSVRRWVKYFKDGNTSTQNQPHSGRPRTVSTEHNKERGDAIIRDDSEQNCGKARNGAQCSSGDDCRLRAAGTEFFRKDIFGLPERWEECVEGNGDYIEK